MSMQNKCSECGSSDYPVEAYVHDKMTWTGTNYQKEHDAAVERMAKEMMEGCVGCTWETTIDSGLNPDDPEFAVYYRDFWRNRAREALKALYA